MSNKLKVGIAADHGGYDLKNHLKNFLETQGFDVVDFGAKEFNDQDDYPDFIIPLAKAVSNHEVDKAVAVCGSGVGASIVANKVKNVRAALIHDHFSAHQGVEDDDMNMLCLGGRVIGKSAAEELILTFLKANFSGLERHKRRLKKIEQLENQNQNQN